MAEQPDSRYIGTDTPVVELLEQYPQAQDVMTSYGFTCVGNPILRRVIPRTLTVATAAHLHGIEMEPLLEALNAVASGAAPTKGK